MPKLLPNIKEDLLQKAKFILYKDGYNKLNIRNLAKECNIGIGTFYNYFSNKDELVKAILKEDWNSVIELLNQIFYNKDFSCKEKLNYIFDETNKFLLNHMSTFMIFFTNSKKFHDTKSIFSPLKKIILDILLLHKEKKEICPIISCEKLSKLILTNIITICKDNYITFEEFYSCLNI